MSNIEDRKPVAVLAERVWSGSSWHYPHINEMIAELTRLRTENDAFRRNEDDVLDMAKEAGYSTPHGESDSPGEAVSWMAEQLERLRAIEQAAREAGLLTEDGALIVPGMRVWVPGLKPSNDDGSGSWVIGSIDHKESVIERQGWLLSQFRKHVGNPYSTPEAAEAAIEAARSNP